MLASKNNNPTFLSFNFSNLKQLLRGVTVGGVPFTRTAYGERRLHAAAWGSGCAPSRCLFFAILSKTCTPLPNTRFQPPTPAPTPPSTGAWELNSPGRDITIPNAGAEIVLTSVDGQRISRRLRSLGSQDLGINFA